MKCECVLEKSKRLHVTKDKVCNRWKEYYEELIMDNGIRDIGIGMVRIEGDEDITKQEMRAVIHLKTKKAKSVDRGMNEVLKWM